MAGFRIRKSGVSGQSKVLLSALFILLAGSALALNATAGQQATGIGLFAQAGRLEAFLTANGLPVAVQSVEFFLDNETVGSVITNGIGLATLDLAGFPAAQP